MTKVLLTGATGFVGIQILKGLLGVGARVVPVVRSGKEKFVPISENVERIVSSPDIFQESVEWWAAQCRGVDTVIHAAWYAEPGKYLMSEKNMDCLAGSLNLARGTVIAGVKRWVGIGTCFEYDISVGKLSIDAPLKPLTPYAGAKASLFTALSHWLPSQSIEFAWCRLFYLYGEEEDERRLVPYLHKKLSKGEPVELTSGTQIRDFLDVSEAARIIVRIALSEQRGPINVCSGVPITVRQLAERIADNYDRRELLKFGARKDNIVDPAMVLGIPNYCL